MRATSKISKIRLKTLYFSVEEVLLFLFAFSKNEGGASRFLTASRVALLSCTRLAAFCAHLSSPGANRKGLIS